ncbi:MAG: thioredoxin family protein [Thermoplasmata archaeon]
MPLIGDKERETLSREFGQKLVNDVRLVVFTQEVPCMFCKETVSVAEELAGISQKIRLEVYDFVKDQVRAKEFRIDKIPAMAIIGAKDYGIRFYGIPSGYEFSALVGAIIDVSRGESGLSPKSKELLRGVDKAVHIQTFVLPTCPYCPSAVRLAHRLAIESDMVWSEAIESNEFVPLAQKYAVMSVPKMVINEKFEIVGAVSEQLLVQHVLHAIAHQEPLQPR